MNGTSSLLGLLVLGPLALAVLSTVLRDRWLPPVGLLGAASVAAATLALVVRVARSGPVGHDLAGWGSPLGIVLHADGLSAVFLLLTALVGAGLTVHAASDRTAVGGDARFWPLWFSTWAGLNAVYVAGDLFNTYVALEVVGIAAVGLVALGGRTAWGPALRYLLVTVLGSTLLLVVVAIVYAQTGTLDLLVAGERLADAGQDSRWAALLLVAGLGLKAALVPMHAWLPPAHGSAPTVVSAILSALVVKAAFFVLVRMWFWVLGPDPAVALLLGLLGSLAVLWGGTMALAQQRLKQVVAYSTVVQMGYLFLFFPLSAAAAHDPEAQRALWGGMAALAVGHGFAKASLFLSAGTLKSVYGTDSLAGLARVVRPLPSVVMGMGVASVTLAGLPPSLGFAGKWQLVLTSVGSGQWGWAVVVIGGGLLSAAYLLKPLTVMLREPQGGAPPLPATRTASLPVRWMPLVLALVPLLAGLAGPGLTDLVVVGAPAGGDR
ncbi:complex I subunit 5 family protein [Kocuria sp. NPDC057446]|uniref:complex I subunit 5 family protein n=1 Tax=Kocuria sp. NPDC057446 TaxID=3346137 RepID=UPI0036A219D4